MHLGGDEGFLRENSSEEKKWMDEIEPSLLKIHTYWKIGKIDALVSHFGRTGTMFTPMSQWKE